MDTVALDQQVPIRGSDVDLARLNPLSMLRVKGGQLPGPAKEGRKGADASGRKVMDHEQRTMQVAREGPYQTHHRLDSSSGESYDDDIVTRHINLFPDRSDS
jgi:hypothetical protein